MANLQFRDVVKKYAPTDQALGVPGGEVGGIPVPSAEDFATAEQGAKADTAVQPDDLGAAATMSPVEVVTDPDAQAALSGAFARLGARAFTTETRSVTSSTTLVDDPELVLPLAANTTYELGGIIAYDGPTGGDIKIRLICPVGTTGLFGWTGAALDVSSGSGQTIHLARSAGSDARMGAAGPDTVLRASLSGWIRTGNTAGVLQVAWAQNASDSTPTRVYENSGVWHRPLA